MAIPLRMQMQVLRHILRQKLLRRKKYPLVLMLEPLFACNLECAGCGKIQYPPEILRRRMTPQECFEAADECGAPIVSIAGGEPLAHPQIHEIVDGLIGRGKSLYLCTNAILLERHLDRFAPSSRLIFSIHLDGLQENHDRSVCREGVFTTALAAIRKAKARGFNVMSNTTVFLGDQPGEFREFFQQMTDLGIDGIMISPGYAYEKAPQQQLFLKREQTRALFAEMLRDWREKRWPFNHSPFYLDFLTGERHYDCTPWGNPLRNIFGWQRPCYMLQEGYAASYGELLETTDWPRYGHASGNPKCVNCMMHCGFEPSAVEDAFSSPSRFIELVRDVAGFKGHRKRPVQTRKEELSLT